MASSNRFSLFLPEPSNDYYQLMAADARGWAAKLALDLEVCFAESAATQTKQICEAIQRGAADLPAGVLIMAVRDNSLNRFALEAASRGIAIVFLNRWTDYVDDLRRHFPHQPIFVVSPDQREIGAIQGRQIRAVVKPGGAVLYVQGNIETSSARERLAGTEGVLRGSGIELHQLDGKWTSEEAERVVSGWLRVAMFGKFHLDLVACQNDAMATGACRGLETVSKFLRLPEVGRIPVIGCDGLAAAGKKMVDDGQLLATIVLPSSAGAGLREAHTALSAGLMPPARLLLTPMSYPAEASLAGGHAPKQREYAESDSATRPSRRTAKG